MLQCAETLVDETKYAVHKSGELYYYDDGAWSPGGEQRANKSCEDRWRAEGMSAYKMREVVRIVRGLSAHRSGDDMEFDLDASKVVLLNGTFDLQTMRLEGHSAEHMATAKLPVTYDPDAGCPVFERCMDDWFGWNKGGREAVLEMFAASMLRTSTVRKGYVHYGMGRNGTSACLAVLRQMLGPQNVSSVEMPEFWRSKFATDWIRGKLANIVEVCSTWPPKQAATLKGLVSGSEVRCEPKYKRAFVYMPYCTMIFTFSGLTPATDDDDGVGRRFRFIPWEHTFHGGDQEVANLPYDESERSGLFNKLAPTMRRLLAEEGWL